MESVSKLSSTDRTISASRRDSARSAAIEFHVLSAIGNVKPATIGHETRRRSCILPPCEAPLFPSAREACSDKCSAISQVRRERERERERERIGLVRRACQPESALACSMKAGYCSRILYCVIKSFRRRVPTRRRRHEIQLQPVNAIRSSGGGAESPAPYAGWRRRSSSPGARRRRGLPR